MKRIDLDLFFCIFLYFFKDVDCCQIIKIICKNILKNITLQQKILVELNLRDCLGAGLALHRSVHFIRVVSSETRFYDYKGGRAVQQPSSP